MSDPAMTRDQAQLQLQKACNNNSINNAEAALKAYPELIRADKWLTMAARAGASGLIEVLTRYGAPVNGNADEPPSTPMLTAIQHNHPEFVLTLAAAGASLPPRKYDNTKKGTRDGMTTALSLARADKAPLLLALRQLSPPYVRQPDDAPILDYASNWEFHIAPLLDSGMNIYSILNIPPAADPLTPNLTVISNAISAAVRPYTADFSENQIDFIEIGSAGNRKVINSKLSDAIGKATAAFPTAEHPADAATFFDASGVLKQGVYHWESLGMLPLLFSAKSEALWIDGAAGMLSAYRQLPAHVQAGIDLPTIQRDTPTPHEHSITVHYMRANETSRDNGLA